LKNLENEIVSILPQKKNKSRYTIKFKSGKVIGVSEDCLISHKISVGQKLSPTSLSKIDNDERLQSIKFKALNYLSYRSRSKKEVNISLLKKGFHQDDIDKVLEELVAKGYLNDKAFAKTYARYLIKTKRLGRIAVKNRFFVHSINQEILNPILDELYDKYPPELLIGEIVKKKKYPNDFDMINDKKLVNHLKRKGFSWSEISTYFNC
jgi:regulatory protein